MRLNGYTPSTPTYSLEPRRYDDISYPVGIMEVRENGQSKMPPPTALDRILVARRFACPTNWWTSCWELAQPLSRNRHPNMTQTKHVYTICCWLEIAGDVISSENVRTIEGYAVLNFEVSRFSSFRYIQNKKSTIRWD